MKKMLLGFTGILILFLFTGCDWLFGPLGDQSQDDGTVFVTAVTLNKDATSVYVGDSEQLFATVIPLNATNTSVVWTSSDINVATVTSAGVVTGQAAGSATITVTTQDGD